MKKKLIAILSILIIALVSTFPAFADDGDYHSGVGEAVSALQALTVGVTYVENTTDDLGEGFNCQIHVFAPLVDLPTHYAFHSSDYISLGKNWFSNISVNFFL